MGFDPAELSDKQRAALEEKYQSDIQAATKDKKGGRPPARNPPPDFDADEIKAAASDHLANLEAVFAEHEGEVKGTARYSRGSVRGRPLPGDRLTEHR